MEWAKEIASDVKLFRHWTLYPVKKYTVSPDGSESPIYDDPMCGSDLWDVQVCLLILLLYLTQSLAE